MSERLIRSLFEMVRIASESGEESEFLSHLSGEFARSLGATCRRDDYGNLIGSVPGKHATASVPLLFAMHGDTVKPGVGIEPVLREGVVSSAGQTILGADCKAGIAEFQEAVLTAERHPPLEFVVTREEETGFKGARNLDYSLLHGTRGFLLDMDSIDAIVVGGPSHIDLDIDITGKAAHSGMEPEKGISAIKAAACAIVVANLGRIDDSTTANVGTIRGGSVRNAIPDRVHIEAEVRSLDHDTCVRVSDTMADVFRVAAAAQGAHAEVTRELGYRAYSIDRDTPLVDIATAALRHAGIEPRIARITGGLESAVYHEHGINVLPLGNGARAEHTVDEHIYVEDMERIVEVIRFLFDRFSDRDLDDLATAAAQGSP